MQESGQKMKLDPKRPNVLIHSHGADRPAGEKRVHQGEARGPGRHDACPLLSSYLRALHG
ncbi:MAG: hypothetical protein M0C28_21860 [Candidatus Moduliflexus flocculans]|nr:hypothetical protein [Candidatus Moduliflexus flocculans]